MRRYKHRLPTKEDSIFWNFAEMVITRKESKVVRRGGVGDEKTPAAARKSNATTTASTAVVATETDTDTMVNLSFPTRSSLPFLLVVPNSRQIVDLIDPLSTDGTGMVLAVHDLSNKNRRSMMLPEIPKDIISNLQDLSSNHELAKVAMALRLGHIHKLYFWTLNDAVPQVMVLKGWIQKVVVDERLTSRSISVSLEVNGGLTTLLFLPDLHPERNMTMTTIATTTTNTTISHPSWWSSMVVMDYTRKRRFGIAVPRDDKQNSQQMGLGPVPVQVILPPTAIPATVAPSTSTAATGGAYPPTRLIRK